jgi:HAD superfamily hydrolase (TIGR01509 family)
MAIRGIGFDYLGVTAILPDHNQAQTTPTPSQAVLDLSDQLRKHGYLTGLLSNLGSGTEWDAALYSAGVDRHFDAVVLSGDLGVAKPDVRAYQALADQMEIKLDELVFIDDRESSLVGVHQLGIRPVIWSNARPIEQLVEQLKVQGVRI